MREEIDAEFEAFVRGRQARLLRAAYLMSGDRFQAEDLVQGALVKLAGRWDRLRNENPEAYVRMVIYHDFVSAWRRTRHELLVEVPAPEAVDADGFGVVDHLEVVDALQCLTRKQRAIIVLRWFEDLSEHETAEILNISVGTVKRQNHDALARLRQALPHVQLAETGDM